MANIFGTRHDVDNRQGCWKLHGVSYIVSKFLERWSANGVLPTLVNAMCCFFASLCTGRSPSRTQSNFATCTCMLVSEPDL